MNKSAGQVYFAVDAGDEHVKIGYSTEPLQRVKAIKDGPSENRPQIAALEVGGWEREQELHRKFAQYREHGEWFRYAPPIREYVSALPPMEPLRNEGVLLRVRMTAAELYKLTELAERESRTKSDTVRLMLQFAAAKMPEGYTGR